MEITANALQSVAAGSNVVFTNTAVNGNQCIMHRSGSGLVSLRGLTNQSRARFKITFGSNIAVPVSGSAGSISLALGINGEPVQDTVMTATPAAGNEFFNVGRSLFIDVPAGCCTQISVENISSQTVLVQNASLIVERVA